jgi:hypothetical protein
MAVSGINTYNYAVLASSYLEDVMVNQSVDVSGVARMNGDAAGGNVTNIAYVGKVALTQMSSQDVDRLEMNGQLRVDVSMALIENKTYIVIVHCVSEVGLEISFISGNVTIDLTAPTFDGFTMPFYTSDYSTANCAWSPCVDSNPGNVTQLWAAGHSSGTFQIQEFVLLDTLALNNVSDGKMQNTISTSVQYEMTSSTQYYCLLQCIDEAGNVAFFASEPVLVDTSSPLTANAEIVIEGALECQFQASMFPCMAIGNISDLCLSWSGFYEPQSHIISYRVGIGVDINTTRDSNNNDNMVFQTIESFDESVSTCILLNDIFPTPSSTTMNMTVHVYATNAAGLESQAAEIHVIVDTVPPLQNGASVTLQFTNSYFSDIVDSPIMTNVDDATTAPTSTNKPLLFHSAHDQVEISLQPFVSASGIVTYDYILVLEQDLMNNNLNYAVARTAFQNAREEDRVVFVGQSLFFVVDLDYLPLSANTSVAYRFIVRGCNAFDSCGFMWSAVLGLDRNDPFVQSLQLTAWSTSDDGIVINIGEVDQYESGNYDVAMAPTVDLSSTSVLEDYEISLQNRTIWVSRSVTQIAIQVSGLTDIGAGLESVEYCVRAVIPSRSCDNWMLMPALLWNESSENSFELAVELGDGQVLQSGTIYLAEIRAIDAVGNVLLTTTENELFIDTEPPSFSFDSTDILVNDGVDNSSTCADLRSAADTNSSILSIRSYVSAPTQFCVCVDMLYDYTFIKELKWEFIPLRTATNDDTNTKTAITSLLNGQNLSSGYLRVSASPYASYGVETLCTDDVVNLTSGVYEVSVRAVDVLEQESCWSVLSTVVHSDVSAPQIGTIFETVDSNYQNGDISCLDASDISDDGDDLDDGEAMAIVYVNWDNGVDSQSVTVRACAEVVDSGRSLVVGETCAESSSEGTNQLAVRFKGVVGSHFTTRVKLTNAAGLETQESGNGFVLLNVADILHSSDYTCCVDKVE